MSHIKPEQTVIHVRENLFSSLTVSHLSYIPWGRIFDETNGEGVYIDTGLNTHDVKFGKNDEGYYIVIGYVLPEGLFAEIEDHTYGSLQGLRYYYANHEKDNK